MQAMEADVNRNIILENKSRYQFSEAWVVVVFVHLFLTKFKKREAAIMWIVRVIIQHGYDPFRNLEYVVSVLGLS